MLSFMRGNIHRVKFWNRVGEMRKKLRAKEFERMIRNYEEMSKESNVMGRSFVSIISPWFH